MSDFTHETFTDEIQNIHLVGLLYVEALRASPMMTTGNELNNVVLRFLRKAKPQGRLCGRHDSISDKARDVKLENIMSFARCFFISEIIPASFPAGFG